MPALFAAFVAAVLVGWKYFTGADSAATPAAEPAPGAQLRAPSVNRGAFVSMMNAAMSNVDMRQIPTDIALVLFDLETGTGRGDIFIHTNNPGSIKSTVGWTGKPSYKNTRVYPTLEDGIRDWVRLISESKVYRKTYAAGVARDFKGFFREIDAAGYEIALDPPYRDRLASRQSEMHHDGWV